MCDPEKHHRHSIRLKGYDYAQTGAYFVTLCTHNRECLFGEVVDGQMRLNEAGHMLAEEWDALSNRFPGVVLDGHVIMPNHVHAILMISRRTV